MLAHYRESTSRAIDEKRDRSPDCKEFQKIGDIFQHATCVMWHVKEVKWHSLRH